jgi:hypothetical protein
MKKITKAVLATAAYRRAMGLTSMKLMLACAETAFVITSLREI